MRREHNSSKSFSSPTPPRAPLRVDSRAFLRAPVLNLRHQLRDFGVAVADLTLQRLGYPDTQFRHLTAQVCHMCCRSKSSGVPAATWACGASDVTLLVVSWFF